MSTAQTNAGFKTAPSWGMLSRGSETWTRSIPQVRVPIPGVGSEAQYMQQQADVLFDAEIEKRQRHATMGATAPMWLEDIYSYCTKGMVDDAIDILFSRIDEMLRNGSFDRCNDLLRTVDLKRLDTHLLVGLLSITLSASSKLPFRAKLVRHIEIRLNELAPNRVERLLNGLR